MPPRLLRAAPIVFLMLAAMGVFLPGINWGLPSRSVDPFLFGNQPVWSGKKILALSGGWDADAAIGADVARHPLDRGDQPILVNGDDVQRARIIQRYRLYSSQPDEMITFRALSGIDAAHGWLDPKLYQYGGLWIYGVGALLYAGKLLGVITVRHDVAFYLDHPEAFGRFYIIARLYAVIGGMVLVTAVYGLVRQIGLERGWAMVAGFAVMLMPVVVNAAHEAKPHLPGAALVLLAVWAAGKYVRSGTRLFLLLTGALCGAAMGMVLWTAPVFVVVVGAVWMRGNPAAARFDSAHHGLRRGAWGGAAAAIGIGLAVYAITNPYVVIHLLFDPTVLQSNLQNTSAMYGTRSPSGALANAAILVAAGMSPVLAGMGIAGAIVFGVRVRKRVFSPELATVMLLAIVGIILTIPYVALAAGKPGEYGRFALVPDVVLAIAGAAVIGKYQKRRAVAVGYMLAAILILFCMALQYELGFIVDAAGNSTRQSNADVLRQIQGDRLAIVAEPAPYCLPPVDLFRWKLLLLPRWDPAEAKQVADVSCRAVDQPEYRSGGWIYATPLSWADKPFEVKGR